MEEKENISPQSLSRWLSRIFRTRYNQYVNFACSYVVQGQPQLYDKFISLLGGANDGATRLWWDSEDKTP